VEQQLYLMLPASFCRVSIAPKILTRRSVWAEWRLPPVGYANDIESGQLWLKGAATQLAQYHPIFAGDPTIIHPQAVALVAYTNMVRTAIEQICMEAIEITARSVGTRGLLPPHSIERIIRDLTLYLRQPAFDAAVASVGRYVLQNPDTTDTLWTHAPSI
jgi:hypothetical protein